MGATKGAPLQRSVRLLSALALLGAMAAAPAGAAEKNPPGDPPGNNGTVKIERDGPNDEDKGNEPIGDGCLIWLEFYGFDQGQTADITFTAHPPSGTTVLVADKAVPISDDAAGGGQDRDAVIGYNLTTAVQGLKAHPKQGYHIKLQSDSKEAPGGAKQKVFWIKCTPAPPSTLRVAKGVEGAGTGPFAFQVRCNHNGLDTAFTLAAGEKRDFPNVPAGTTCTATETDSKGATSTKVVENPPDATADGQIKLAGGAVASITFTNVFPGTGGTPPPDESDLKPPAGTPGGTGGTAGTTTGTGGDTSVLGENLTNTGPLPAGSTLPRTGGDPSPLLTAGLWSLSGGALALVAGRRRRR